MAAADSGGAGIWEKLPADEFKKLQEYTKYTQRRLKDVVQVGWTFWILETQNHQGNSMPSKKFWVLNNSPLKLPKSNFYRSVCEISLVIRKYS